MFSIPNDIAKEIAKKHDNYCVLDHKRVKSQQQNKKGNIKILARAGNRAQDL